MLLAMDEQDRRGEGMYEVMAVMLGTVDSSNEKTDFLSSEPR